MKHTGYTISDASKHLNVEAHVLRYWEEELELNIQRNELGHRCYSEKDILLFQHIRVLKDEGFSLHDIKTTLPELIKRKKLDKETIQLFKSRLNSAALVPANSDISRKKTDNNSLKQEDKLTQFKEIMDSIISQAISNNNKQLSEMICENTSERIIKEMNYLFRTLDDDENTRIMQLEAAIEAAAGVRLKSGNSQGLNVAATLENNRKKKHFFKRKNK